MDHLFQLSLFSILDCAVMYHIGMSIHQGLDTFSISLICPSLNFKLGSSEVPRDLCLCCMGTVRAFHWHMLIISSQGSNIVGICSSARAIAVLG